MGNRRQLGTARNHRNDFLIAAAALIIGLCIASFGASAQPQSCPAGQAICAGSCINTLTDTRNCGSCGNSCAIGQACTAGQCVTLSCPAGQAQAICAGSCINTLTDTRNCGSCGNSCSLGQACISGQCSQTGPPPTPEVFACQFTIGKLVGNTIVPTGITLTGPAGQPCTNNYGSSGIQVRAPFACQFTVGKLTGDTIIPTGIILTGPTGALCTDNYGSSGTQVPAQN